MRRLTETLAVFVLLGASGLDARPAFLLPRHIAIVQRHGDFVVFDLDYGFFEIRQAKAFTGAAPAWPRIKLPPAIMPTGRSYPAIDFVGNAVEKIVFNHIKEAQTKDFIRLETGRQTQTPQIYLADLSPVHQKKHGLRLASGELWLGRGVAVKFSLMKSKWSDDPKHWWLAFPGQWDGALRVWRDVFVIKDKAFKQALHDAVRQAYLSRYGVREKMVE